MLALTAPPLFCTPFQDTINEETVELMQPYLDMEDYNMESAKKVCGDVAGLAAWTEAMATFYGINKEVLPLKANLAVQEAKYGVAMKDLNAAQATLDEKQRELDAVQAQYDAAMSEKQVRQVDSLPLIFGLMKFDYIPHSSSVRIYQQE